MTSHHTIYDITCTVFMTSLPGYLKWRPPYLCHHNDFIDGLRPTVCMTSHAPYVCHLIHSTQCHIHSLWLHTIVDVTLNPLHSWHHTPCIWNHTHGNTNVISAIWPTISNTTSTVSVSSKPGYHKHHTHSLNDITHTIVVTSYSVCMLSQQLFMILYPSIYNITPSIFMISYPICTLSPYCFHDNTTTIPGISPTIFDTTATVSVSSHRWHTHLYRCIALSMTLHPLYHTKLQYLWCHIHFRHDITPPVSDMAPTVSLSSQPLQWYLTHFEWHHTHLLCDIICTTYNITPNPPFIPLLYLWQHNLYIWDHIQYIRQHIHYIWDITANICVLIPTL